MGKRRHERLERALARVALRGLVSEPSRGDAERIQRLTDAVVRGPRARSIGLER